MQEFADVIIQRYSPPNAPSDKTKIINRIRAVLNTQAQKLGSTEKAFLEALLAYWGTVSDLVQRQEHGGQKEGSPLLWIDSRRVVFQIAIIMFEIDGVLSEGAYEE